MQWIIFIAPLLVVLGHQKCGAVNAACSGEKMPSPNLQAIVDKIANLRSRKLDHTRKGIRWWKRRLKRTCTKASKMYSPIAPSSARRYIPANFKR